MSSMRFLLAAVALLSLLACTAPPPAPTPPPDPAVQQAIERGATFLLAQFDPPLGLLRESPRLRPDSYFLANDALLASQVLTMTGATATAARLDATLAHYGVAGNGLVEAAWGAPIPWPPQHFTDPGDLVAEIEGKQIMTVRHDGPGYFYDWSAYANLAFIAAVNERNLGNRQAAQRLYTIEAGTFDGRGFADKAFWDREGVYETLGLAWGVYAAALLCVSPRPDMLAVLLAQQDPISGGFYTHYSPSEDRLADPNVETTSVALLALLRLAQPQCRDQLGIATTAPSVGAGYTAPGRPLPTADRCVTVRGAVGFLAAQYDPAVRLLRESPLTAADAHWLGHTHMARMVRFEVPVDPNNIEAATH